MITSTLPSIPHILIPFSLTPLSHITSHHIITMKLMNVVGSLFTASSNSRRQRRNKNNKNNNNGGITKHTSSFSSTTSSSSSDCPNSATTTATTPKSVLPISVADVFNLFDRDRDGKITRLELESVLRQLGPDPLTDGELATMVREMDVDGDGCISLEELSVIGAEAMEVAGADDDDGTDGGAAMMEELRGVFRVFDMDGDGKISAEELKGVFEVLGEGEECGMEDCRRMIQGVDSDGDGFVGFEDFVKMMRMGPGGHSL